MKILFVANGLGLGGVETNIARLTEELVSRKHEVMVASGGGVLRPRILAAPAEHIPLRLSYQFYDSASDVLADSRLLRQVIREQKPDVVHVFSASTAVLVRLAQMVPWPLRQNVVTISSIMGLHMAPSEAMWKVAMRAYATCTGATKIIVISPAIGDLLRRLPVRASRCVQGAVVGVTIPDNVEMARRNADAVRAELEIASGDRVVMTIGGLDPRKSHELFLRGAAEVLSHRDDVRFFVVGAGPLRPDLIAEIDRLGITSNVRLLGERTDLDRLLSAADLYVRPGIVEGFIGTTLLDAQALEIPVVAFDTRDVRVAIAHGRTGWLVPPGDTSALAGAVIALLDNPALSRTIGKAGRAQVETHFSVPAVAGGLESLYRAQLDHLAPSS